MKSGSSWIERMAEDKIRVSIEFPGYSVPPIEMTFYKEDYPSWEIILKKLFFANRGVWNKYCDDQHGHIVIKTEQSMGDRGFHRLTANVLGTILVPRPTPYRIKVGKIYQGATVVYQRNRETLLAQLTKTLKPEACIEGVLRERKNFKKGEEVETLTDLTNALKACHALEDKTYQKRVNDLLRAFFFLAGFKEIHELIKREALTQCSRNDYFNLITKLLKKQLTSGHWAVRFCTARSEALPHPDAMSEQWHPEVADSASPPAASTALTSQKEEQEAFIEAELKTRASMPKQVSPKQFEESLNNLTQALIFATRTPELNHYIKKIKRLLGKYLSGQDVAILRLVEKEALAKISSQEYEELANIWLVSGEYQEENWRIRFCRQRAAALPEVEAVASQAAFIQEHYPQSAQGPMDDAMVQVMAVSTVEARIKEKLDEESCNPEDIETIVEALVDIFNFSGPAAQEVHFLPIVSRLDAEEIGWFMEKFFERKLQLPELAQLINYPKALTAILDWAASTIVNEAEGQASDKQEQTSPFTRVGEYLQRGNDGTLTSELMQTIHADLNAHPHPLCKRLLISLGDMMQWRGWNSDRAIYEAFVKPANIPMTADYARYIIDLLKAVHAHNKDILPKITTMLAASSNMTNWVSMQVASSPAATGDYITALRTLNNRKIDACNFEPREFDFKYFKAQLIQFFKEQKLPEPKATSKPKRRLFFKKIPPVPQVTWQEKLEPTDSLACVLSALLVLTGPQQAASAELRATANMALYGLLRMCGVGMADAGTIATPAELHIVFYPQVASACQTKLFGAGKPNAVASVLAELIERYGKSHQEAVKGAFHSFWKQQTPEHKAAILMALDEAKQTIPTAIYPALDIATMTKYMEYIGRKNSHYISETTLKACMIAFSEPQPEGEPSLPIRLAFLAVDLQKTVFKIKKDNAGLVKEITLALTLRSQGQLSQLLLTDLGAIDLKSLLDFAKGLEMPKHTHLMAFLEEYLSALTPTLNCAHDLIDIFNSHGFPDALCLKLFSTYASQLEDPAIYFAVQSAYLKAGYRLSQPRFDYFTARNEVMKLIDKQPGNRRLKALYLEVLKMEFTSPGYSSKRLVTVLADAKVSRDHRATLEWIRKGIEATWVVPVAAEPKEEDMSDNFANLAAISKAHASLLGIVRGHSYTRAQLIETVYNRYHSVGYDKPTLQSVWEQLTGKLPMEANEQINNPNVKAIIQAYQETHGKVDQDAVVGEGDSVCYTKNSEHSVAQSRQSLFYGRNTGTGNSGALKPEDDPMNQIYDDQGFDAYGL